MMSLRAIVIAAVVVAVWGGSTAWAQGGRPARPTNLGRKSDAPNNNNRPAQPSQQILRRVTPKTLDNRNASQNNNRNNDRRDNDRNNNNRSIYYNGGVSYSGQPGYYNTPVPIYPTTPTEFFGYINPGNLPSNGQPFRPIGQNGSQITYPTPRAGFRRGPNGTWPGTGLNSNILIFRGYCDSFIQYQSVFSPFGWLYPCPSYIGISYIISTPWIYSRGQNISSILYTSEQDAYLASDAERASDLKAAIADLRRFWENEDQRVLQRRARSDQDIAILYNEEYKYSVNRGNFLALAGDAMASVITLAYEVTDVQRRNDGLVNVYAKHQYRIRETGEVKTAQVRTTLIYLEGAWYINGISLAQ